MWLKTHALYIMLPAFILLGIVALVHEVGVPHRFYKSDGRVAGDLPHRPAEYPDVFNPDPLEGIHNGSGDIHVAPPPVRPDLWPCSQCHDPKTDDPRPRELRDEHKSLKLRHGDGQWCLDCHDFQDPDKLHLANGEKITLEESYRLCAQCHGEKYNDWRLGIHGQRTGFWNGSKRYLLCVNCHSPHDPHFKPLQPLPPPVRPEFLRSDTPRYQAVPAPSAGPSAPLTAPSTSAVPSPSPGGNPSATPSSTPEITSTSSPASTRAATDAKEAR